MGKQLFANSAKTYLASDIGETDTTLDVTDASDLPAPSGGDWFLLCAYNDMGSLVEIFKCTDVSGTTVTIERGQENTSKTSHTADPKTVLIVAPTKGTLEELQNNIAARLDPKLSNLDDPPTARSNLGLDVGALQDYFIVDETPDDTDGDNGDVWYVK